MISLTRLLAVATLLLFVHDEAKALTYRIGHRSDRACSPYTLAQAIAAAKNNPGPDHIRVVMGNFDSGQSHVIDGQDLTISGGYETCSDTVVDLDRTTISASGTGARVFTVFGPGVVVLENLQITGGSAFRGGGIFYEAANAGDGADTLILRRTNVVENEAAVSGGGIYFSSATGRPAELVLEEDTGIFRNIARGFAPMEGGGGLYLSGNATLHAEGHRLFFEGNFTFGDGGAIYLAQPASADIGSAYWDRPTFHANFANQEGGAIHVDVTTASAAPSMVRLYSIIADRPMQFALNQATELGGAISVFGSEPSARASICTRNINFNGNRANAGSALRLTHANYGFCGGVTFPATAVAPCQPRSLCNRIEGHGGMQRQGASLIRLRGASADLRESRILSNTVDSLGIADIGSDSDLNLINSLVAETQHATTQERFLFSMEGINPMLNLTHTTVSQPAGAGSRLLYGVGNGAASVRIENSILDLPEAFGGGFLGLSDGEVSLNHVLMSWMPSIAANPTVIADRNPQFTPDGSYRLLPTSPAVDFAPHGSGFAHDIDGNPRIDLRRVQNRFGPIDLGAYEVQSDLASSEVFLDGFED